MAVVAKWSLNGNSNDSAGTLNGVDTSIQYVAGKSGQGASFDGSTSDILINNCDINITTTYTIGMLLKYNTLPSSGSVYNLIIKGEPVNPTNGFDYIVFNNSGVYQIYMTHATASGGTSYFFNIPTPVQGTWYYYVIKYESSQLSFYINGILVGTKTATVAPTFNTNLMYFGYNGMAGIRRFNGVMDDIIFYNSGLTDSEIKNKYLYYNGFI